MKSFILKSAGFIVAGVLILVFFLSGRLASVSVASGQTVIEQPFKIGEKISIPNIWVKPNSYVDDIADEDVTGDGINDLVILAGVKEDKGIYSFEHTVIVKDGSSQKYLALSAGQDGGYDGKLFIGDFNGDKVSDILVSAATGGSGGTFNYSILTFAKGVPGVVASQDVLSPGAKFTGHFKDGFKAEIKSVEFDKAVDIDISSSKEMYVGNGIFNNDGRLLKPVDINTDAFSLLKPVDLDQDGVYELEGYQRIWGFFHLDIVSEAKTTWKIQDGKLALQTLELTTFVHP